MRNGERHGEDTSPNNCSSQPDLGLETCIEENGLLVLRRLITLLSHVASP